MMRCQCFNDCEYESMEPADDIMFCAFHASMLIMLLDFEEQKQKQEKTRR